MIKVGNENPVVSFNNGRVVWAKQSEVQVANLKGIKEDLKDGEEVAVNAKDLGSSEVYAQEIKFSPNGRYFTMCSESDYVIYGTHKFANQGFGSGVQFEWGLENYATRQADGTIKIFKNFIEVKSFKTEFTNQEIFGGKLLGITSSDFISFYDWNSFSVVRRIDVVPKAVYWSESGTFVIIATED